MGGKMGRPMGRQVGRQVDKGKLLRTAMGKLSQRFPEALEVGDENHWLRYYVWFVRGYFFDLIWLNSMFDPVMMCEASPESDDMQQCFRKLASMSPAKLEPTPGSFHLSAEKLCVTFRPRRTRNESLILQICSLLRSKSAKRLQSIIPLQVIANDDRYNNQKRFPMSEDAQLLADHPNIRSPNRCTAVSKDDVFKPVIDLIDPGFGVTSLPHHRRLIWLQDPG
jgi:hypothetical protein